MDIKDQKHKIKTLDSTAVIDEKNKSWEFTQDETPFIEQAKQEREATKKKDLGYKKMCSIPMIVQLEIFENYGVDIQDPEFMHDHNKVLWLMKIMKTEYPHLMSY